MHLFILSEFIPLTDVQNASKTMLTEGFYLHVVFGPTIVAQVLSER